MAKVWQQTLWEIDGTVNMTDMGWVNGFILHYFLPGADEVNRPADQKAGTTFVRDTSASSACWFRIDCRGADRVAICGKFNVVDKGTAAQPVTSQIRAVCLGQPWYETDPDYWPQQTLLDPNGMVKATDRQEINNQMAIYQPYGGVEETPDDYGYEFYSLTAGGREELQRGIVPLESFNNGDRSTWVFMPVERSTSDAAANKKLVRSPINYCKNTEMIFMALAVNPSDEVHTTTKLKGKVFAQFFSDGD